MSSSGSSFGKRQLKQRVHPTTGARMGNPPMSPQGGSRRPGIVCKQHEQKGCKIDTHEKQPSCRNESRMLLNCGAGEDFWESLELARRSNHWILKEINPEYSLEGLMLKDSLANTLATWCKEQTHWKRPWCWEKLKVGEGDNRDWVCLMASPTRWTWL